jgi:hypothetical protein
MEGFIFTSPEVISSVKLFVQEEKCDFLDMGFEKRYMSRNLLENLTIRGKNISEIDYYHQNMINRIFKSFSKDKKFLKLYKDWASYPLSEIKDGIGFHHVPSAIYSISDKLKLYAINLLKRRRLFPPSGDFILETPSLKYHFRKKVNKFITINNINYHSEEAPYYFGCMCQHLFSNSFLTEMSRKYDENDLWNEADQPFSASALEVIWGILPSWLGFKKWFFDGVHRPRKNFLTFIREDDIEGVCRYLNIYYKNQIRVQSSGDYIKIVWSHRDQRELDKLLGNIFFNRW